MVEFVLDWKMVRLEFFDKRLTNIYISQTVESAPIDAVENNDCGLCWLVKF